MAQYYARLRPWDPKGGQPHKDTSLAMMGMKCKAGKFFPIPKKIEKKFREYLADQFPEGDTSRPCLYQVVTEQEMKRIISREQQQLALKQRAAAMGMTMDEMRRLERQSKPEDRSFDVFDHGRTERLRNRPLSDMEQMAAAMSTEKPKSEIEKIAAVVDSEEEGPFIDEEESQIVDDIVHSAEDDEHEDDELWSEMQGELSENESAAAIGAKLLPPDKEESEEEVAALLSEASPKRGG